MERSILVNETRIVSKGRVNSYCKMGQNIKGASEMVYIMAEEFFSTQAVTNTRVTSNSE